MVDASCLLVVVMAQVIDQGHDGDDDDDGGVDLALELELEPRLAERRVHVGETLQHAARKSLELAGCICATLQRRHKAPDAADVGGGSWAVKPTDNQREQVM